MNNPEFSKKEIEAIREKFTKRQADVKVMRFVDGNEGYAGITEPFLTATSKFVTPVFPQGKWWEDNSRVDLRAVLSIENTTAETPQSLKRHVREMILDKLGFFKENGELVDKAERELMTRHFDSSGRIVYYAQSPFIPNVFLEYTVKEHRDPTSLNVISFTVNEFIRQVPNTKDYRASFRDNPTK